MKDKHVIIIGAGSTISQYKDRLLKYIYDNNIVTIGINRMTSFCIPDYHLWTNKKRFASYHECISDRSKLLFGCGMKDSFIKKYWDGDYDTINFSNNLDETISYKGGAIHGNFRTAGILAVMIAHIKGAKKIDIIGMDGYTFYSKNDLINNNSSHHCYGSGFTDDASWEDCVHKDELVYKGLRSLNVYGVKFRIITPTKFGDFYDSTVLE